MSIDLILGTAGHIDHGKTSLIRALTGVDTDRLPEEKRRGITIDLGFAALDLGTYRLGIVDVPGHERFVRNMLAGATGMDVALLVVAANDSVKPQTREHFEILRLLDLKSGVIALTKVDLADSDWIELVEEEIRELIRGSFLEQAPMVRVSAITGEGIDELRGALLEAAENAVKDADDRLSGPFRMAIDRVFTLPGHGTIVTGSVASGRLSLGDEVAVEPGGLAGRIRGLQHHDRAVDEVHRGQRAAINLAGIHHGQVDRGQEVASPGHLVPSRVLTVEVSLLPAVSKPLKHRTRVRIHLGTAEFLATVCLLDRDRLAPGEKAFAQLVLSEPAVSVWGQPFIVRRESPVVTMGGGRVLDPAASRIRRKDTAAVTRVPLLGDPDEAARAAAAIYFRGLEAWQPTDLARLAGSRSCTTQCHELERIGQCRRLAISQGRNLLLHAAVVQEWCDRIEQGLSNLYALQPRQTLFDISMLYRQFSFISEEVFLALLETMRASGRIRMTPQGVGLAGQGPSLSPSEQRLYEQLIAAFHHAGFQPPSIDEARKLTEKNQAAVADLLSLAETEGQLTRINKDLYLHSEHERRLREIVTKGLRAQGGLTVSQIKDLLGTSRKYGLPFCEYLDRIRLTKREGDIRTLHESAD